MKKLLFLPFLIACSAFAQESLTINSTTRNVMNTGNVKFAGGKLFSDGLAVDSSLAAKEVTANKGAANGYAGLDGSTKVPIAQIPTGSTSSTVPFGNDARFSDARAPTAHAATHASAGSDPVTLAMTQITGLATALAGKQDASGAAAAVISDTAYNATSWDGVTTIAPSKNAVRDKFETLGTISTLSATNPTFTGATVDSGSLILSGNQSAAAWTTNGLRLKGITGTLTDTTSTGTVAAAYTNKLGGNTIASSSATTFTDYISAYFSEPVAGTNVTFTNKWGLGADSLRIGTSNPLTVSLSGVLNATSPVFVTPALGTPASGVATNLTSIPAANLLIASQAAGDLLYASSASAWARLADVATGSVLVSGGVTTAPLWASALTSFSLTTPKITTGINDVNGNSMLAFTATGSAVDGFTFTNAATANPATVTMAATGSDTNIGMTFANKGSGGTTFTGTGGTGTILTVKATSASGYNQISMLDSAGTLQCDFGYGNSSVGATYKNRFYLETVSPTPIAFIPGGTLAGLWYPTGGLYIGNGTPSDPLAGNVKMGGTLFVTGASTLGSLTLGTPLAVAQGGTGDTGTAWGAYTPTISAGSGTFTSATATGAYKTIGKTVHFRAIVTITTNGTAAAFVSISLPIAAVSATSVTGYGAERGNSGKGLVVQPYDASNVIARFSDTVAYPGGNGAILLINGAYESN